MFTAENVLRNQSGSKTQTRRTQGLKQINEMPDAWERVGFDQEGRFSLRMVGGDLIVNVRCPFGDIGDGIWVKETWRIDDKTGAVIYRADGSALGYIYGAPVIDADAKWKSAMFMFKHYSRQRLVLTAECRLERVQDISLQDIMAEGIRSYLREYDAVCDLGEQCKQLWDSINAKKGYGWDKNIWVWVISYHLKGSTAAVA